MEPSLDLKYPLSNLSLTQTLVESTLDTESTLDIESSVEPVIVTESVVEPILDTEPVVEMETDTVIETDTAIETDTVVETPMFKAGNLIEQEKSAPVTGNSKINEHILVSEHDKPEIEKLTVEKLKENIVRLVRRGNRFPQEQY